MDPDEHPAMQARCTNAENCVVRAAEAATVAFQLHADGVLSAAWRELSNELSAMVRDHGVLSQERSEAAHGLGHGLGSASML